MRLRNLYPGIVSVSMDRHEKAVLQDVSREIEPVLPTLGEAEFLDLMAVVGMSRRGDLPAMSDLLAHLSEHRGAAVVVFELGADTTAAVGPTPDHYHGGGIHNLYAADILRGLIVGLAGWYGYGYSTQQHGVVHNDVIPVKEMADIPEVSAAVTELGLHVEDASFNLGDGLDISPDFLTLHFFRNDDLVPTILSIPDWSDLAPRTMDLLRKEWFFNRTNPGQGGAANDPSVSVAICYGPSGNPWIRLNTGNVEVAAYEPRHATALLELVENIRRNRVALPFRPGQVVVIDNRRVLHGRRAYRVGAGPRYDGTDRWQRRLACCRDPARLRQFEIRPRVVDPRILLESAADNSRRGVIRTDERHAGFPDRHT
ncbi:TauD/TfdA family dioxygenase [Nocardia sp. CA-129566]|uniref:TauD/TfdA family dioxygenase n=1 Tax=Nocardia sp. CA-129566 TaxID=3239976 RepID=UPI003D9802AB